MIGHRTSPPSGPTGPGWILGSALALGLLLVAHTADAYCRSTTCTGTCARDADGCKTEGHPLYWTSMCVGFSIQEDGSEWIPFSEVERVIAESFVAWSDLPCTDGNATIAFSRAADVACHQAEYNLDGANANIVMFQDHKWDYTGPNNTLAKTTVTYDNETGEILDADIEMNHAFNEYTTSDDYVVYDLQAILTHEIGHLIGLDHSPYLSATMEAGYQQGSTDERFLDQDDVDGVCAVYPPGRDAVCDTRPKGGFTGECTTSGSGEEEDGGCSVARAAPPQSRLALLALASLLCGAVLRRRR
ncbi:MAG: matrixin family metalloprotease [Deltaproteobacteria bacterium]|jgi:hypothetical protein|nr:matrixin family metalloprotease [Deltaproteobacteria bacterium]MBW2531119.1 matrixin family metalloprotease [Deltaproteobacteria bacterium]